MRVTPVRRHQGGHVIAVKFTRVLLTLAVVAGAAVSPLVAAGPAAAACARDPYNHACVPPARYRLRLGGSLAVQRQPRTRTPLRRVSGRATVGVLCQIT